MATNHYSDWSNKYRIRVWIDHSQNIANNTSTITWYFYLESQANYFSALSSAHLNVGGTRVKTYSNTTLTQPGNHSSLSLGSGSRTITHNSDGSLTVHVEGAFKTNTQGSSWSVNSSISFHITMPTIPRLSTVSLGASSVNVGSTLRVNVARASSSFTHKVYYRWASESWTHIASDVATAWDWTVPTGLANSVTSSNKRKLTIAVDTFSGGTRIPGSTYATVDIVVPDTATYRPTVPAPTLNDTVAMTGISLYTQGMSRIRARVTPTAKAEAWITQTRVTIEGTHYYGGASADITGGLMNTNGIRTVYVYVTDSRGYTGTSSVDITVHAYAPPQILSFTANRVKGETSDNLSVNLGFKVFDVGYQNTKSYTIWYRPSGGSWITMVGPVSTHWENTVTHTLNGVLSKMASYEVWVTVKDSITESILVRDIQTEFQLMNFNESGRGLAIGQVSTKDAFQVNMDIEMRGKKVAVDTATYFHDNRATNRSPEWYYENHPREVVTEFKQRTALGLSAAGTYVALTTYVNWTDASGGPVKQIAIDDDGNIQTRTGAGTGWGVWRQIMTNAHIKDYVVSQYQSGHEGWVRWNSGRMEQWGRKTDSRPVNIAINWSYRLGGGSIGLHHPFVGNYTVSLTAGNYGNASASTKYASSFAYTLTTPDANRIVDTIDWHAIGRWW